MICNLGPRHILASAPSSRMVNIKCLLECVFLRLCHLVNSMMFGRVSPLLPRASLGCQLKRFHMTQIIPGPTSPAKTIRSQCKAEQSSREPSGDNAFSLEHQSWNNLFNVQVRKFPLEASNRHYSLKNRKTGLPPRRNWKGTKLAVPQSHKQAWLLHPVFF